LPAPKPQQLRSAARALRRLQVPLALIAEQLGVSVASVWNWTRDIRIEPLTRDSQTRYASRFLREKGLEIDERRRRLNGIED
jgi:hypothetical protein